MSENKILNKKREDLIQNLLKSNNLKQSNLKYYFTYTFKESLNNIYSTFSNIKTFNNEIFSNLYSNISFSHSENLDEEGNILKFCWKNFYNIQFLCTQKTSSKNFKSFTVKTISISEFTNGNFSLKCKFFYNSCERNTLLVLEFFFDYDIGYELFKDEVTNNDLINICNNIDEIEIKSKKNIEQIESIIINTNLNDVWNLITDFEKCFNGNYKNVIKLNVVNEKGEKIIGNELLIGNVIKVIKDDNKIISDLVITDIKIDKENFYYKIEMETKNNEKFNNDFIILKQNVIFGVKKLEENISFLYIKHLTKDFISDEKLNTLSLIKKKLLLSYKMMLEGNFNVNVINDLNSSFITSSSNSLST